jgi:hypothetical protein
MKLLLCAAAFLSVAIAARYADAEEKRPSKPVVCSAYRIVEPSLALCSDSKKPFVMTRFAEVAAPGKESGTVKVLVGWR